MMNQQYNQPPQRFGQPPQQFGQQPQQFGQQPPQQYGQQPYGQNATIINIQQGPQGAVNYNGR
jgi:hypothetical protein